MVLRVKEFSNSYNVANFINHNEIKQGSIQAIICDNEGVWHLYYWRADYGKM